MHLNKVIVLDCETFMIKPGRLVPTLVCMAWLVRDENGEEEVGLLSHLDDIAGKIREFVRLVKEEGYVIVNHNIAFDMAVLAVFDPSLLEDIFDLYEAEKIEDTMLNEQLIDNAKGMLRFNSKQRGFYTLGKLANRRLGVEMDKTTWRTGYEQFYDIPIEEYPDGAREYPIEDVINTLKVRDEQLIEAEEPEIPNTRFQAKAHWALHLMSAWGIRTDKDSVDKLEADLEVEIAKLRQKAQEQGFIRENGTKNLKAIREFIEAWVPDPILTKTGQIATSKEALEAANIKELADYNHTQKLLTTYVPALKGGIEHPINAGFRPLVETGRVSCRRPNLMNLPRFPGVRECFIPRDGYIFCTVDYDTLELCTLAQCCIWLVGESELGEALNAGLDPHLQFAANMMDISYEKAKKLRKSGDKEVKHFRQLAKVANFGLPGGLGAKKFVKFAAGQDVFITLEEATALKNHWLHQWPEMQKYFGAINRIVGHSGEGTLVQFVSNRVRGGVTYTAACNSFFQGLAADGAKEANFRIQRECYVDRDSTLFGSRMTCFVHDETILEHPVESAEERAFRQAEIMCEAMKVYVPDIKISASPALMTRWYKDAEGVYDENGKLIPWEPEAEKEAA